MSPKDVSKRLHASYGIFSSGQLQWAELSFSQDRARVVWSESLQRQVNEFVLRFIQSQA